MTDERRNFRRRATRISAALESLGGDLLDGEVGVKNLSVEGARITTQAGLLTGGCYRIRLEGTSTWVEIAVREKIGGDYRCQFETPWEELHDVIRQSDDLTLLVLESSDPDKSDD